MGVSITITIPKTIYEKALALGVAIEDEFLEFLSKKLSLNPDEISLMHAELAEKFLREGESLLERDPVQASEKLYKAAEESVKALANYLNLREILTRVESRGRWTVTDLERAVREISKHVGEWFRRSWDSAWVLHVWGFHEGKLDRDAVRERLNDVKRIVGETIARIRCRRSEQ